LAMTVFGATITWGVESRDNLFWKQELVASFFRPEGYAFEPSARREAVADRDAAMTAAADIRVRSEVEAMVAKVDGRWGRLEAARTEVQSLRLGRFGSARLADGPDWTILVPWKRDPRSDPN